MIQVEHLSKSYGTHRALRDISFSIGEGEVVGFLGPNGAGKSTTMNILTGCLSAGGGRVTVDGIDILEAPAEAKRRIGYLPEQPPLYTDMTVEEYLGFVYDLKGCTLPRRQHLEDVMQQVHILDVRARLIRNLSKGYRQRVGIAQALTGAPPVLIFDEPTVGLDPKQIIEVRNLLRTLGRRHTVILSTHILPEVQAVCDRLLIINEGELIADKPTEELTRVIRDGRRYRLSIAGPQKEVQALLRGLPGVQRTDPTAERDGDACGFVIETAAGLDIRRALFEALAAQGWALYRLEPISSDLEDVFLQLIGRGGADASRPRPGKQGK